MAKAKPTKPKSKGTSVENSNYKINTTLDNDSFLDTYVFGDISKMDEVVSEQISTGIIPMDILLGGGVCDGDIVMLYSSEGVGKTTLALQMLKKMIDLHGKKVLYVDIESGIRNQIESFKLMPYIESGSLCFVDRFKTVGEVEKLFSSILARDELPFDFVVIDSITNLLDDSMLTRSVLDPMMAGQAKAVTYFLQKFRVLFKERGITTILINQERANLDCKGPYDRKTKAAGCKALHYIPDVIVRLRKGDAMKAKRETPNGVEEIEIGRNLIASADKNRKGNPFISISFPLKFGVGVSNILFVVKLLKDKGYVKQAGAYFRTSIIPNPEGTEWNLQGTKGLTHFVDTNFEAINNILINDNAYRLIGDELEGDDDI